MRSVDTFERRGLRSGRTRARLYAAYAVLVALALGAAARRPVAFQKSYAIQEGPAAPALPVDGPALDVRALLGPLPYTNQSKVVYAVLPAKKYQETIVQGFGNCSNLVFGAAYYLDREGYDYQMVHALAAGRVLEGWGHAVLRTRYALDGETRVGLVDVLEGGIPRRRGQPMDIQDLERGAVAGFSIRSLNDKKDPDSPFYGEMLDGASVAYIHAADVRRYFRFLERIYVPLGSERLEKYLYDGIAVVLGVYPKIVVRSVADTFAGLTAQRRLYRGSLGVLRSALGLVPFVLALEVTLWARRRRSAHAVL